MGLPIPGTRVKGARPIIPFVNDSLAPFRTLTHISCATRMRMRLLLSCCSGVAQEEAPPGMKLGTFIALIVLFVLFIITLLSCGLCFCCKCCCFKKKKGSDDDDLSGDAVAP